MWIKQVIVLLVCVWVSVAHGANSADRVRVEVVGIEGEVLENVTRYLTLIQQKSHELLTDERIAKLHKKTPQEIRDALQPFGYYRAEITSELTRQGDVWVARYLIDAGPLLKIATLDLQVAGAGKEDPAFEKLARQFPVVVGQSLEHARYEAAKNELMQLASERGYLDAQFELNEIRVDLNAYSAAVAIHFNTGERYSFGNLLFKTPEFNAEFLQRYATFSAGDAYTFSALLDLQNALTDSDYFSQVEVKPLREQAQDHVLPVEVDAEARERTRYTMGFGYGTDKGARLTLGVERRYVNKDGHRWSSDLKVSEIDDSLTTRYTIPLQNPRTDQFVFKAEREGERDRHTQNSTSKKYKLSGSHSHLGNGWQKTFFLNYEYDEKFVIGGQTGSSTLVIPGINWTRIRANNRIYTTYGHRFVAEVSGGSETLGSTASFVQGRLNAKFVRRFRNYGRWLVRGDAGYTEVLNFEDLPPSVRFFAGGDFSVRGYAYKTLGPKKEGEVIGGTQLLVGSTEYEQILNESWSLAVFYDVGNAMNSFETPLARGIGMGVRYRSPIGLIRFDLAQPQDDLGESRYFHIAIGPDL